MTPTSPAMLHVTVILSGFDVILYRIVNYNPADPQCVSIYKEQNRITGKFIPFIENDSLYLKSEYVYSLSDLSHIS